MKCVLLLSDSFLPSRRKACNEIPRFSPSPSALKLLELLFCMMTKNGVAKLILANPIHIRQSTTGQLCRPAVFTQRQSFNPKATKFCPKLTCQANLSTLSLTFFAFLLTGGLVFLASSAELAASTRLGFKLQAEELKTEDNRRHQNNPKHLDTRFVYETRNPSKPYFCTPPGSHSKLQSCCFLLEPNRSHR